jgi:thioredoxin 1
MLTLNESNFRTEVLESSDRVLVDFYASWCPACQELMPTVEELSRQSKVVKVDTDRSRNLTRQYGIRSLPTCVAFSNGQEVGRLIGVQSSEDLQSLLNRNPGFNSIVEQG